MRRPTKQIGNPLLHLLIRDNGRAHAGLQLERFCEEMPGRAKAADRNIELVGMALEEGNKLRKRLSWKRRIRVRHQNQAPKCRKPGSGVD